MCVWNSYITTTVLLYSFKSLTFYYYFICIQVLVKKTKRLWKHASHLMVVKVSVVKCDTAFQFLKAAMVVK